MRPLNNMVIVPNGKLAQTILTNYYLPEQGNRDPLPAAGHPRAGRG